jgi:hypothetical protein
MTGQIGDDLQARFPPIFLNLDKRILQRLNPLTSRQYGSSWLGLVTRIDLCNASLPDLPYFWMLIFTPSLLVDPARHQKDDGTLY